MIDKYLTIDGERFFLTITTTLNGKWIFGYSTPSGKWLDKPRLDEADTLEEIIAELTSPSTNKETK